MPVLYIILVIQSRRCFQNLHMSTHPITAFGYVLGHISKSLQIRVGRLKKKQINNHPCTMPQIVCDRSYEEGSVKQHTPHLGHQYHKYSATNILHDNPFLTLSLMASQ